MILYSLKCLYMKMKNESSLNFVFGVDLNCFYQQRRRRRRRRRRKLPGFPVLYR
ncbi:unnamed protein product [Brassica oleracea]